MELVFTLGPIGYGTKALCCEQVDAQSILRTKPFFVVLFYKGYPMNLHLAFTPLVSLVACIVLLVMPRLLNYFVAIYLIVIGLIGLFGTGNMFR